MTHWRWSQVATCKSHHMCLRNQFLDIFSFTFSHTIFRSLLARARFISHFVSLVRLHMREWKRLKSHSPAAEHRHWSAQAIETSFKSDLCNNNCDTSNNTHTGRSNGIARRQWSNFSRRSLFLFKFPFTILNHFWHFARSSMMTKFVVIINYAQLMWIQMNLKSVSIDSQHICRHSCRLYELDQRLK